MIGHSWIANERKQGKKGQRTSQNVTTPKEILFFFLLISLHENLSKVDYYHFESNGAIRWSCWLATRNKTIFFFAFFPVRFITNEGFFSLTKGFVLMFSHFSSSSGLQINEAGIMTQSFWVLHNYGSNGIIGSLLEILLLSQVKNSCSWITDIAFDFLKWNISGVRTHKLGLRRSLSFFMVVDLWLVSDSSVGREFNDL